VIATREQTIHVGERIEPKEWEGRIWVGDCLEFMRRLPDGCVDLVLTDPPYGLNYNNGDLASHREAALGKGEPGPPRPIDGDDRADWVQNLPLWMQEFERLLKPGCCCCCCGGGGGPQPIFGEMTLAMDRHIGFKQAVVWDKGGLGMGWHYRRSYEFMLVAEKPGAACQWYGGNDQSNVVRIPKIIPSMDQHPTQKPDALMGKFVLLHSAPGALVLGPFLGSGTTAAVCERLGRRWMGCEINPDYAAMAQRRIDREREKLQLPLEH